MQPHFEMPVVLYINGVLHHATHLGYKMVVDHPNHPFVRCAEHSGFGASAVEHLKSGGKVRTSGCWYSLRPDKENT